MLRYSAGFPDCSISVPRLGPRSTGLLLLAITSLGWGFNWPAMKILLREWPPLFARGTSGLCAAVLLALLAVRAGQSLALPTGAFPRVGRAAFFNVFAWMGFSTLAMRWLGAGQGALLVYTMPAWATLFEWPLRGKRPGVATVAGLVLCFTGVGLLFLGSGTGIEAAQAPGVVFALGAAVLFAFGTVVASPVPMPPLAAAAWQLLIGCAPMLLLGLLLEEPKLSSLTSHGMAVMVYMTLVPMGLCYLSWFAALRRLPPTLASIAMLMTPVVGVVAAAISLGEPLGLREFAAMALTLAGVAVALRTSGR